MVDQLHAKIVEGLAAGPDDRLFELCAVELLKPLYRHLVWIPGGSDFGADAVADSGEGNPVLGIITTSNRGLDNLRRNLTRYLDGGGPARNAVFATTHPLSATKRRNLHEAAHDLGFVLLQEFDQHWFAEELYRRPDWRIRLLGLPGDLPALSLFPRARLPQLPTPLIGREKLEQSLLAVDGDVICYGRPGVGKTAALRRLANEGWGLFLTDRTAGRLADAIRETEPKRIIVDDAHFDASLLTDLRSMRQEMRAAFQITAISWPDPHLTTVRAHLEGAPAIEIPPLSRQKILEVIEAVGVRGPREFQRLLVDQARGRAGLAATLASAAINGGIREVAAGDALFADTQETYRKLLGDEAVILLGMIALGDRDGASLENIAEATGKDLLDLSALIRGLASGGTIDEAPDGRLLVQPESLRYALVKAVFFGLGALPLNVGLSALDEPASAVVPLVAARHRGAAVPLDQVLELARRGPSRRGIEAIASLGEQATEAVLEIVPNEKKLVGESALSGAPRLAFHLLMESAVGYSGEEHSDPGHPIRLIADHCRDRSARLDDRRLLVRVVREWVAGGGDQDVALRAAVCAVNPGFETHETDAGEGRTIYLQSGLQSFEMLKAIGELWDEIVALLETLRCDSWVALVNALGDWFFPGRLDLPGGAPQEVRDWMRARAAEVATSIGHQLPKEAGVLARLSRDAKHAEVDLVLPKDRVFEVLFPEEDIDARRVDWRDEEQRMDRDARAWADSAREMAPHDVVGLIADAEEQARRAGITYPRMTLAAADQITASSPEPDAYVAALVERSAEASILYPFLVQAVSLERPGCEDRLTQLLESDTYRLVAVAICLTQPVRPALEELAVERCDSSAHRLLESICIRRELKESAVPRLLEHPDAIVAGTIAAAIARERTIPAEHQVLWEETIVRCPADDHWTGVVLRTRPELLVRWVGAWAERQRQPGVYERIPENIVELCEELPVQMKLEILNSLSTTEHLLPDNDLVATIVGNDLDMAQQLFDRPELVRFHEQILRGPVAERWLAKARLAVDRGWTAERVVAYVWLQDRGWTGEESNYWNGFVEQFAALPGDDPVVVAIRTAGVNRYSERRDRALAEEEREAIYGD